MAALWAELRDLRTWAVLIEAAGSVVVAGYCTAAFAALALRLDRPRAQRLVADGALTALSFMVCATLLKTLLLTSWPAIGAFAAVLLLRTVLKHIFMAEQRDA